MCVADRFLGGGVVVSPRCGTTGCCPGSVGRSGLAVRRPRSGRSVSAGPGVVGGFRASSGAAAGRDHPAAVPTTPHPVDRAYCGGAGTSPARADGCVGAPRPRRRARCRCGGGGCGSGGRAGGVTVGGVARVCGSAYRRLRGEADPRISSGGCIRLTPAPCNPRIPVGVAAGRAAARWRRRARLCAPLATADLHRRSCPSRAARPPRPLSAAATTSAAARRRWWSARRPPCGWRLDRRAAREAGTVRGRAAAPPGTPARPRR